MDVKRDPVNGDYEVRTHNGRRRTGERPTDLARNLANQGAGEIVVNSIDRDGAMKGYDLALARAIREATTLPITVLGGAGSLSDIKQLVRALGVVVLLC